MLLFFLCGCAALLAAWLYAARGEAGRLGQIVENAPGAAGAMPDPRLVSLLVVLGGGAILYAMVLLVTERVFSIGQARIAGSSARPPQRRRTRLVRTGSLLLLALGVAVAVRWTFYVNNQVTPFDEVGIALNTHAPEPLRRWGCARLKATFGATTVAPMGCGRGGTPLWQ